LGLGTFGLGFADVEGEAGPFTKGEVDEVVDGGDVIGDEVDTPETESKLALITHVELKDVPSITITR
jgi:hypothetical protein